jgi:hypothetical protein
MYKCIECKYSSQKNYNVKRHMFIKHNLSIPCKNIPNTNVVNTLPNVVNKNQCKQCEKVYSSKGTLTRHLLICKGFIKTPECEFCKKKYANNQSKTRHQLTCKETVNAFTIINHNDNSITNNITINNSITNNITINNFGNENLTYISDEMLEALTNNVDARGMIDVIYFNDAHPENHNIELYSNKKQLYKFYKNSSFSNVMNIDLAHNQMICKMVKLFMDKILEEEDMDQKNSKLHNLHYYNKTKSETVKLLSKHIYSQILSRTLQKIDF